MDIEGRGIVPPAPIRVAVRMTRFFRFRELAARREAGHRYSHSSRAWARGFVARPMLIGLMGEEAFATFASLRLRKFGVRVEVDEKYRSGGDDGIDFRVAGVGIQVKTRQKSGDLLIRREDEGGQLLTLPWDIVVVATWVDTGDDDYCLSVSLDGWVSKRQLIQNGDFQPARRGQHHNLELPDQFLNPMGSLVKVLRAQLLTARRK
jgi:hypothetical protein